MGGFAPLRAGLAIYLLTSCHYICLMLVTTCICKVKQQLNGLWTSWGKSEEIARDGKGGEPVAKHLGLLLYPLAL